MRTLIFPYHKNPAGSPKSALLIDVFKFLLVIGGITWLMVRGTDMLGYNWQWYRVPQYLFSFENNQLKAGDRKSVV